MMKKLLLILISLGIFIAAGVVLSKYMEPLKGHFTAIDKLDGLCKSTRGKIQNTFHSAKNDKTQHGNKEQVAVHFKDGSVMVGEMIRKTEDAYHIKWKGEETIVYVELVDHITSAKDALKEKVSLSDEEISQYWPYENDIVIRMKNRAILDSKINRVSKDKLTLLYTLEGGGTIEQDVARSEIEYLIFKPVDNEPSQEIESSLKELFPKMEFYKDGNFTIVTDSYITWVTECRKVLRETYTNIYLEFFPLFKDRKPGLQNFVVIFDDYGDFVEYAVADGVPGWMVAGYFSPEDKVLYLFNVLGDKFSEILFEGMVGESGRDIDEIVDTIEGQVDKRYHIFIEGQAKKIKDKFWEAYTYYKGMFRDSTLSTLRHEFAHEVFHNWGLQSIGFSRFEGPDEELVKKKKEFLETKDYNKKAKLLRTLVMQKGEDIPLDMKASNSWLAEGIATYCETMEIGAKNYNWLFMYQEMSRKGPIYPLEFLMAYKIGSFPGVYPRAMLDLYAQSWAFASFLMEKYPKEFMDYQNKLIGKTAEESEDVEWLTHAVGKDLRTIESEFVEYMNTFKELEDPFLVHFDKLYNIYN